MTSIHQSNSKFLRAAIPWLIPAFIISGCNNQARNEWQTLETSAQNEAKAGNTSEAEKHFQLAIKKADELQNTELIVTALLGLSDFYYQAGKSEKCFPLLTRAHSLSEKQLKEFSRESNQRSLWRSLTARCALARANVFRDHGKYFEAEPLYQRAAEVVCNGKSSVGSTSTTTTNSTASTIAATTTTRDTNTAGATTSAGDTITRGDTKTTGATITDAELLAKINQDVAQMEEYRHKSDDYLDEVMLSGKQIGSQERFQHKLAFDGHGKEFDGLEHSIRSDLTEKKLKDRASEAKALFDVHEGRYRQALSRLCYYYIFNEEFDKAKALLENDVKHFKTAEKATRADLEFDPERVADAQLLADDLSGLGDLLSREGNYYSAMRYRERAVAMRERLGPRSMEFVAMRRVLADSYSTVHNYQAAIDQLDKALSLYYQVGKESPKATQAPSTLYLILTSMASIEQIEGSYTEATRHLKEARALLDTGSRPDSDLIGIHFLKSAELAGATGHFKEQKDQIKAAIDYWKKHFAKDPVYPIIAYTQAGQYYYANHDYSSSIKALQLGLDLMKNYPKLTSLNSYNIDLLQWLALTNAASGNTDAAERLFKEAKNFFVERKMIGPAIETQMALNEATVKRRSGQFAQARGLFIIAETLSRKIPSESPDCRWSLLINQCMTETMLNNYATARSIGLTALEEVKKNKFRSDLVGKTLCALAWSSCLAGDTASAQRYLDQAEQACSASMVPHYGILADIHVNRSRVWFLRKQDARANEEIEKAHTINQKVNANFDNALFDWELENLLRCNRRPPTSSAISQEKLRQIVEDLKSADRAFQPACAALSGATFLTWSGHPSEGQQMEKFACELRDAELKRRPLQ